jgi:hypothetical protein
LIAGWRRIDDLVFAVAVSPLVSLIMAAKKPRREILAEAVI